MDKGNNWSEKGKLGDCPFSQVCCTTCAKLSLN